MVFRNETRKCLPPCLIAPEHISDAIDIHRELTVKANTNGCVVMRSTPPADLEVAGDAERAHTWVSCGSNRQMSVRSNAVTMSTLSTPLRASSGSGARGIIDADEAPRPRPTRRDLRRVPTGSIGNFKNSKNLFLTQAFNPDANRFSH